MHSQASSQMQMQMEMQIQMRMSIASIGHTLSMLSGIGIMLPANILLFPQTPRRQYYVYIIIHSARL